MFFVQPGNVSREVLLAIKRGFEELGQKCLTVELAQIWKAMEDNPQQTARVLTMATDQIARLFVQHRVELSVGMWSNAVQSLAHGSRDGKMVSCFELMKPRCPHVMYWLDAPHWSNSGAIRGITPTGIFSCPALLSFVNNEGIAEEMRRVLGFRHACALDYGVDAKQLAGDGRAEAMEKREFDLVFALGPGDPKPTAAVIEELSRDEPDVMRVRTEQAGLVRGEVLSVAERLNGALRDAARALLDRLLISQVIDRATPMLRRLEGIVNEAPELRGAAEGLLHEPWAWVDAGALIRLTERMERAMTVAYFAKRFKTLVYGANDLDAWQTGATRVEFAPDQGAQIRRGRVGLSVMRWQDDVGVHIKPLEIAAAGSVALVARRAGIERLLEDGSECVVFDSLLGGARALRGLMDEPGRMTKMAAAGRGRVEREHTWKHRAAAMLAEVSRDQRWR